MKLMQKRKVLKEEAIPAAIDVCVIKSAQLSDSNGDYAPLYVAIYEDRF